MTSSEAELKDPNFGAKPPINVNVNVQSAVTDAKALGEEVKNAVLGAITSALGQASAPNNNFGIGNIPSAQDYEDLRNAQRSFAQMAAYLSGSTINVSYKNNPQRYTGGYVTEDFFKILGVSPIMGRDFTVDDNKPGAEKVTILSHEIWQRDFNGDRNVVGQAGRLPGRQHAEHPAQFAGQVTPVGQAEQVGRAGAQLAVSPPPQGD